MSWVDCVNDDAFRVPQCLQKGARPTVAPVGAEWFYYLSVRSFLEFHENNPDWDCINAPEGYFWGWGTDFEQNMDEEENSDWHVGEHYTLGLVPDPVYWGTYFDTGKTSTGVVKKKSECPLIWWDLIGIGELSLHH
jgi:hypothetical protein